MLLVKGCACLFSLFISCEGIHRLSQSNATSSSTLASSQEHASALHSKLALTSKPSISPNFKFLSPISTTILSNVVFASWPHKKIFNGDLEFGMWHAGVVLRLDIKDKNSHLNQVQSRAIMDGYFLPKNFSTYHLFSAHEAKMCFRGKKIILAGDSYMKSFFIGLVDILLDNPSNLELRGGAERETVLKDRILNLARMQESLHPAHRFSLSWEFEECFRVPFPLSCYTSKISNSTKAMEADAFVFNTLVHDLYLHYTEHHIENYLTSLRNLFETSRVKLTWVLGPTYDILKVPLMFQNLTKARPTDVVNRRTLEMANMLGRPPILDVYTLTGRCYWSNCTSDGGHRARFVNRMKAQMLLNNLCKMS